MSRLVFSDMNFLQNQDSIEVINTPRLGHHLPLIHPELSSQRVGLKSHRVMTVTVKLGEIEHMGNGQGSEISGGIHGHR
jgi:hypothetical protein